MKKKLIRWVFVVAVFGVASASLDALLSAPSSAQDRFSEDYNKWFNWKINYGLDDRQKEVLGHISRVNEIFEKTLETETAASHQNSPLPDPPKDMRAVEKAIIALKEIDVPEMCASYVSVCVEILECVAGRQKAQVEAAEAEDHYLSKGKEHRIYQKQMALECKKDTEYFNMLNAIGFFDDMEEEVRKIGIGEPASNLSN